MGRKGSCNSHFPSSRPTDECLVDPESRGTRLPTHTGTPAGRVVPGPTSVDDGPPIPFTPVGLRVLFRPEVYRRVPDE